MELSTSKDSVALAIAASLSIVGSLALIATFVLNSNVRKYRHAQFVFYVTVNDLFAATGLALGYSYDGSIACWYQGITSNYNFLSGTLWNTAIAFQLYWIIYGGTRFEDTTRIHIICWGFPIITTLLPLTTNTYGNADADKEGWCFIGNRATSPSWGVVTWELLSYYLWLWVCVVIILFLYYKVAVRVLSMDTVTRKTMSVLRKFSIYPMILILCWAYNTFTNLSNGKTNVGLIAIFPALQGLLNSIAFFITNIKICPYFTKVVGSTKPDTIERPSLQLNLLPSEQPRSESVSSAVSLWVYSDDDEYYNTRFDSRSIVSVGEQSTGTL